MNLAYELRRTAPDCIVFNPGTLDQNTHKTGNEHFLVEKLTDGTLIAIWTQSSFEGRSDQHIQFAKSTDDGSTWDEPRTIAQADPTGGVGMASWAFPLVSRSGRIYALFSRHMGVNDLGTHVTGRLSAIASDDEGATWTEPVFLTTPRSIWDNEDPTMPPNCIVWQKPQRLSRGKYFVGQTRWITPAQTAATGIESVSEFLRFENVDDDPAPEKLEITFLMQDDHSLHAGKCLEEPSIVALPDGRLFTIMRSREGYPFYSLSKDDGDSWSAPEPLRRYDDGPLLPQPHSPCPIYQMDAVNYVFFYHNHDGRAIQHKPGDFDSRRRPLCLARAMFRPGARQPLWFSDPWYFMDTAGVTLLKTGLSLYSSVTPYKNGITLWYPDRKFFLLGRRLTPNMIENLRVPEEES